MPSTVRTLRRAWLSAALVLPLLALAGCAMLGFEARRPLSASVEVPAGVGTVAAAFVHGDMEVQGGDGSTLAVRADVTVLAESQAIADEVAAELAITFPVEDGVLRVVVAPRADRWPRNSWSVHVASRLDVPHGLALDLVATHGDLVLRDVTGPVSVVTTHGDARVERTRGRLALVSTHGHVVLDDVAGGPVSITTTHGDVTARALDAPFALVTTHGDVDLALAAVHAGRSSVVTTHGDVDCRLPASARVLVEASSSHDEVRGDFPGLERRDDGREVSLRLGDGGDARLGIATTHGDVRLLRAAADAEERM